MESLEYTTEFLELDPEPSFLVQSGVIVYANDAARKRMIEPQQEVLPLLCTGIREYSSFSKGQLSLRLCVAGTNYDAQVSDCGDHHLFRILLPSSNAQLQTLALAAQELRQPLANLLSISGQLFPNMPEHSVQTGQFNRGLHQLLRIVSNMSDTYHYSIQTAPVLETVDFCAIFREILEKAQVHLSASKKQLTYTLPQHAVFGLADPELLSRAAYNLLSNAAKFSDDGGCIHVKLSATENMLFFCVSDNGEGLGGKTDVFNRYCRAPGIEDGRLGLGLGMEIVRCAAVAHGGTVLMESQEGQGLRITMTIRIKNEDASTVRSPVLKFDSLGGMDLGLIQMSDALDANAYIPE